LPDASSNTRIRETLLDTASLVEAVLAGRRGEPRKVVIRVVRLRNGIRYQVNTHRDGRSVTRNLSPRQFATELDALLSMGWRTVHIAATDRTLEGRITKRDTILLRETPTVRVPSRSHDVPKRRLLTPDAPFLRALAVATADGIRADKQAKYQQIDKFLRLLEEAGRLRELVRPITVVDLGCGNAHLTFATYHYLNNMAHVPTVVTGVDVSREAIDRNNARAKELGWPGLRFVAAPILDYEPDRPPNLVLALHACDTATDEALARAVQWRTEVILAAPCCHHHVQTQLRPAMAPDEWRLLLRHRIVVQRLGDLLTDALRASILTMHGYRTDVFQFVATEHTPKNVMIRAVRDRNAHSDAEVRRYRTLCDAWSVTPRLQELLGIAETRLSLGGTSPPA
jgi:SAM-dependent methyltransferase